MALHSQRSGMEEKNALGGRFWTLDKGPEILLARNELCGM